VLPLAFELGALPGVELVRACDGHEAGGHRGARPRPEVAVAAASPVFAEVLAGTLAARCRGAGVRWAVVVSPEPVLDATCFAVVPIAPDPADAGIERLRASAAAIATGLAGEVRARARAALRRTSRAVVADGDPGECPDLAGLTPREREVLAAFLQGYGVTTIAARAGRSAFTIRNQLKSVCAKLEVSSQRELREYFAARSVFLRD